MQTACSCPNLSIETGFGWMDFCVLACEFASMLLLIPGPVTTRPEVRQALTRDIAPWDNEFRSFVASLRTRILHLAGGVEGLHATVPLQGCGHFITEAALRTFLPPGGRILIPATGAYAGRMIRLAAEAGRVPVPLPIGLT